MVEAVRSEPFKLDITFIWFIDESFSKSARVALSWISALSLKGHCYEFAVDTSIVKIDCLLGYGRFSTVYRGTYSDNSEVVVKVFADTNSEALQREKSNLEKLQVNKVPNVPTLVVSLKNALIMKPCANHLKTFDIKEKHITEMVTTLCKAHEIDLVHRDVREPNLLLTNEGGVLVNDWGSALYAGYLL